MVQHLTSNTLSMEENGKEKNMSEKMYKAINNEKIELTAEEIAELETKQAEGSTEAEKIEADIQAQKDLKASAKAKLVAGEALTPVSYTHLTLPTKA